MERLWTVDRDRYVLIRPREFSSIPTVYDKVDFFGFHIEDDELAAALVEKMIDAGVSLVDEAPPGMNPIERKQLEMLDAGAAADEINEVVREMREKGIGNTNPLFKKN